MLHQSPHSKRQLTVTAAFCAGAVAQTIFTVDLSAGYTAASDKIELGAIPPNSRLTSATVIGEGLGAITADVGIMSGVFGDNDDSRTVGDEIFDAVSVNDNEAAAPLLDLLAIAASDDYRPIGAVLSADVAAGAGKKLTLVVEHTF